MFRAVLCKIGLFNSFLQKVHSFILFMDTLDSRLLPSRFPGRPQQWGRGMLRGLSLVLLVRSCTFDLESDRYGWILRWKTTVSCIMVIRCDKKPLNCIYIYIFMISGMYTLNVPPATVEQFDLTHVHPPKASTRETPNYTTKSSLQSKQFQPPEKPRRTSPKSSKSQKMTTGVKMEWCPFLFTWMFPKIMVPPNHQF